MKKIILGLGIGSFLIFSVQCTDAPHSVANKSHATARGVAASADWLDSLDAAGAGDGQEYYAQIERMVAKSRSQGKAPDQRSKDMAARIAKYIAFVMYNYNPDKQPKGAPKLTKTKDALAKEVLSRLFQSNTQFIMCPDLSDYECLEKTPEITPTWSQRQEDPSLALGAKKELNADFSKSIEWHFTDQLFVPEDKVDLKTAMASHLEKQIKTITSKQNDAIYMAVYGVDDIDGSMKGVYTALIDVINKGIPVEAVFDDNGMNTKIKDDKPLIFTYVKPSGDDLKNWILSPIDGNRTLKDGAKLTGTDSTNMAFQYNGGTQGLIAALSKGAKKDEDAHGRLEWKNHNIMHNKFLVFKKGDNWSVWTGTANVAHTCMGTDRNSNMAVLIKNNDIAKTYLDEFNEMYTFQDPTPTNNDKHFVGKNGNDFPIGRFHEAKTVNTHRYFYFTKDDTDVRVYFSPTDDGEHHAILPMIYSARKGDTLRLSMFGSGGMELSRAVFWAAANGVKVELIADTPTSRGNDQFLGKAGEASLFNPNPYDRNANAIYLANNDQGEGGSWGQNHQKIGLLIRKDGTAEQMIFGSQNWTYSGNDVSDENLIALRNEKGLAIGDAFNDNFTLLKKHAHISTIQQADKPPTDEESGQQDN